MTIVLALMWLGLTDTPSLYVDGVKVPATYDPVTGTLTPTTPLADGAHSITTTLTDAAGNESPQSAAPPPTVDTAAPAALAALTSTAPSTNDNTPGIHIGVGRPTRRACTSMASRCRQHDPVTGTLTPTTPLGDGVHQFTTTLTDAAGNVSPVSPALALTVDTAAPAAPAALTSTAPSTNDNTPGIHIGVGLRHAEPVRRWRQGAGNL